MLDENVYIFALESEGKTDDEHLTAARFVDCLQKRHKWVLTPDVVNAYRRQFGRGRFEGALASEFMNGLEDILFSDRCIWFHRPSVVANGYDENDIHVVAAAAASAPSVLVTTDGRLARQLAEKAIPENHGFKVMSPPEALRELCG